MRRWFMAPANAEADLVPMTNPRSLALHYVMGGETSTGHLRQPSLKHYQLHVATARFRCTGPLTGGIWPDRT